MLYGIIMQKINSVINFTELSDIADKPWYGLSDDQNQFEFWAAPFVTSFFALSTSLNF